MFAAGDIPDGDGPFVSRDAVVYRSSQWSGKDSRRDGCIFRLNLGNLGGLYFHFLGVDPSDDQGAAQGDN